MKKPNLTSCPIYRGKINVALMTDTDKLSKHIENHKKSLNFQNLLINIQIKNIPDKKEDIEYLATTIISFINEKSKNGIMQKTYYDDIKGSHQDIFNHITSIWVKPSSTNEATIQCNHDGYSISGTIIEVTKRYLEEINKRDRHYTKNDLIFLLEVYLLQPGTNVLYELRKQAYQISWNFKEIWIVNVNGNYCDIIYPYQFIT